MKKLSKNTSAFTLIELLVAMTILGILAVMSYGNYLLYQKKEMVRQGQREISKSLIEARNMAINGYDAKGASTDNENKSIGVEITPYDGNGDFLISGNKVVICSFSSTVTPTPTSCSSGTKVEKRTLPRNVVVNKIDNKENENFFAYFEAVTGEPTYYVGSGSGAKLDKDTQSVNFTVSYGGSTSYLTGGVEYYTKGFISDFNKN